MAVFDGEVVAVAFDRPLEREAGLDERFGFVNSPFNERTRKVLVGDCFRTEPRTAPCMTDWSAEESSSDVFE